MEKIYDAQDLIAGRLATVVAKQALLGAEIRIINSENAVITGKRKMVQAEAKQRRDRGIPSKGPFIIRSPERYLKRLIRGMLPHKSPRGVEALARIKCYVGTPEEFKEKKVETVKEANVSKLPNLNYVTIGSVCKHLGAKI